MKKPNFKFERLHYRPEVFVRIGSVFLGVGVLIVIPLLMLLYSSDRVVVSERPLTIEKNEREISSFSLNLKESPPIFPSSNLNKEVSFSFAPPRPLEEDLGKKVLVRIKHSGESKRITLPARINLEYSGGLLRLAKEGSKFWVDLSLNEDDKISAVVHVNSSDNGDVEVGSFFITGEESPFRMPAEFVLDSPFRILSEAKWWGRDLLNVDKGGERLEIAENSILEASENDWFVWLDGKWQISKEPSPTGPIAHVISSSSKSLLLEGWDSEGHYRFQLGSSLFPPFRTKIEDIFSSIRIRSEKQISCMMEKQCMVLKVGDWVLKSGGKWRILRKKDEHEALLNGKLTGELFVFEQITQNQGQKMIRGRLYNTGRSQFVLIEAAAASSRKKVKAQ